MVAFDLDGTLLDSRKKIRSEVKIALNELQRTGVMLTLITGRSFAATLPFIEELDIMTPVGVVHGSFVRDKQGLEIAKRVIPKPGVRDALDIAEKSGCIPFIVGSEHDGELIICEEHKGHPVVETVLHAESDQVLFDEIRFIKCEDIDLASFGVYLVGMKDSVTEALTLCDSLPVQLFKSGLYPIHATGVSEEFENQSAVAMLSPVGADKAFALREIADCLGVGMETVAAFGDWHNDIPMLEAAGTAILMGNAPKGLYQKINHPNLLRTGPNDGSGIIEALRKLGVY
ncbi:MAG: HAD family phosphatase [Candidatus Omnitrophica bacterium]|nr:HAD family phosphatase [Candidatus Omnitrophota bacterium]